MPPCVPPRCRKVWAHAFAVLDGDIGQLGEGEGVEVCLQGAVVVELSGHRNHPLHDAMHHLVAILPVHAAGLVDHEHDAGANPEGIPLDQDFRDRALAQVQRGALVEGQLGLTGHGEDVHRRGAGRRRSRGDRVGRRGVAWSGVVVHTHAMIGDERGEPARVALPDRPHLPRRVPAIQLERDHDGFGAQPLDAVLVQHVARLVRDRGDGRGEPAEGRRGIVEREHRAQLRDVLGQLGE